MNAATPEQTIREALDLVCLCSWDGQLLGEISPDCALHGEGLAARAALDELVAENARYRDALEWIARSYNWIPFEDGETLPNAGHESITPTNRRIAREALAGSGGDTTNG